MGVIVTLCILILIAYVFDITSSKTKIPSIILLLFLGWLVHQVTIWIDFRVPDLHGALPGLGTVGLILIVLEGALELELDKSKRSTLGKSFLLAFIPMAILVYLTARAFIYWGGYDAKDAVTNAFPLAIISSAIAIPTALHFSKKNREFVIYESSLSDILGVMFFNFFALNAAINGTTVLHFFLYILAIIVISFVASAGLAFLLSKIDHHVKFVPIILLVIMIYVISKELHLPALVFIMVFGIFIANLDRLRNFKIIQHLKPEILNQEVNKFREIIHEATFLVRSLFFLLFGFLIDSHEIIAVESLPWALAIVVAIYSIRSLMLILFKMDFKPLIFMAPRGLITILLFLSIPAHDRLDIVNNSLIMQVIILTALIMMFGNMSHSKKEEKEVREGDPESPQPEEDPAVAEASGAE